MASVLSEQALANALAPALASGPLAARLAAVVDRRPNPMSTTFVTEIVTCRLADGMHLTLLCKYEAFIRSNTYNHWAWGHRRGSGYEAEVYRRILEPIGGVAPRWYGTHHDSQDGTACFFLEYLEGAHYPDAVLPQAATWLARFHRHAEPLASSNDATFLTRYDRDYFAGWADRAEAVAKSLGEQYSWVPAVCERFLQYGAPELERHPTVIHGECYHKNILQHGGRLYGIDWESCAVGAAEIDLAMLLEGWPDDLVAEAERDYARTRWPKEVPTFVQRLAIAQMYMNFRWLGDGSGSRPPTRRLDKLQIASIRAGLLT